MPNFSRGEVPATKPAEPAAIDALPSAKARLIHSKVTRMGSHTTQQQMSACTCTVQFDYCCLATSSAALQPVYLVLQRHHRSPGSATTPPLLPQPGPPDAHRSNNTNHPHLPCPTLTCQGTQICFPAQDQQPRHLLTQPTAAVHLSTQNLDCTRCPARVAQMVGY